MNESFDLRLTNHRNLATSIQMHRRKFIKQVIELSSTSKISPEGRIPYKKCREVIKKNKVKNHPTPQPQVIRKRSDKKKRIFTGRRGKKFTECPAVISRCS